MATKKDVVMRISETNHKRLKKLKELATFPDGKEPTANQLFEKMLDTVEQLNGDVVFLVEDRAFNDVSDARGECILRAVRNKTIPIWPKIAVVVAEDEG